MSKCRGWPQPGDRVRVLWFRGIGWRKDDFPGGRPGTVKSATANPVAGVIGMPDIIVVRLTFCRSMGCSRGQLVCDEELGE